MDNQNTKLNKECKKSILNRISRAQGHLDYVKRMVENDRDPSDILMQLSAVKSAINSTGIMMIEEQVDEAVNKSDKDSVTALLKAMERYCK